MSHGIHKSILHKIESFLFCNGQIKYCPKALIAES